MFEAGPVEELIGHHQMMVSDVVHRRHQHVSSPCLAEIQIGPGLVTRLGHH